MHKGFVTLLFFAIIAVLILTHAQSFAAATTAVGGQTYGETALLPGNPPASEVPTSRPPPRAAASTR